MWAAGSARFRWGGFPGEQVHQLPGGAQAHTASRDHLRRLTWLRVTASGPSRDFR
jgi:hypothetical protein